MKILSEVGPVQLISEGVHFYVLAYGERVRLPPQRAKVLLYLMERADGPAVKKEDMYRELWSSSESGVDIVSVTASYLRRALA